MNKIIIPLILALAYAVSPAVQAEVFKCKDASGKTAYQEEHCHTGEQESRVAIPETAPPQRSQPGILTRESRIEILNEAPEPPKLPSANAAKDFEALKHSAEKGDPEAQYKLGQMYASGRGAAQNDDEAVKWYRESAEQGNAAGQYGLGGMYLKGRGVPQSVDEAMRWYQMAADQGHTGAQGMVESINNWQKAKKRKVHKVQKKRA
ncbi:MAG: DUF4124 domain-containing protein [Betaproteobacteria bacterium]|nr:DUF4124 domain-containing protein [Betaproteobacteria bacterium]